MTKQYTTFNSIYHKNNTTFFILAFIIDKCNYKCSYCYNVMPRTNQILDLNKLYDFLIYLHNITGKKIEIDLVGGEPTLHPDFINFCKKIINNSAIHCAIYSNFSADCSLYNWLLQNNIYVTLSTHYSNKKFIQKLKNIQIDKLVNNNLNIRVMFEIEEDQYTQTKNICLSLLQNYKSFFEPALIQYKNNSIQYTKEQMVFYNYINSSVYQKYLYYASYLNKNIYNNIYLTVNDAERDFKNFKYWKCNAGFEYLYVHSNGNTYRCINEYERHYQPIINIQKERFNKLKLKPMICLYDICPCIWEVHKEKVLNV